MDLPTPKIAINFVDFEIKDGHVEYRIAVKKSNSNEKWITEVRYSALEKIHQKLAALNGYKSLPHFPTKVYWGNLQRSFITQRQIELQRYFTLVLHEASRINIHPLLEFLELAGNNNQKASLGQKKDETEKEGPFLNFEERKSAANFITQNPFEIKFSLEEELTGFKVIKDQGSEIQTLCFEPSTTRRPQKISILNYPNASPVLEFTGKSHKPLNSVKDKRERYFKTKSFPQSAIGVVLIKHSENETTWGTGVMIGPDIVLTAAHNVYNDAEPVRKKYANIKFIPGINGNEAPFGEIKIEDIYAPEAYINHKGGKEGDDLCPEDYALLMLKIPIGMKTGYFGLHIADRNMIKNKEISIIGYPGDKVLGKQGIFEQWGEKGKIEFIESQKDLIHYEITTYSGQSGSGVIYEDEKRQFYVIGVHVMGDVKLNSACWLTRERFFKICVGG
jgi:V8-like Glu-specific endopeptidase